MKSLFRCFLAAALLSVVPAHAADGSGPQQINIGAFTCYEFVQEMAGAKADDAAIVLTWIDGYLSGISGNEVLNFKVMEKSSVRLVEYCAKHGDTPLLTAARAVGRRSN